MGWRHSGHRSRCPQSICRVVEGWKKEDPITNEHKNLAATLQDTLERAAIRMSEWLFQQTGFRRLCLSGGSALNCSMNGKLALLPWVDEIFIQPAAYDADGARRGVAGPR